MNRMGLLSRCLSASLALFAGTAGAQAPPSGRVSVRPLVGLALQEPVLKALGIAADAPVVAQMKELAQTFRNAPLPGRGNPVLQGGSLQSKYDEQLEKLLTAEQFARLRQIHWQLAGMDALKDRNVVEALSLSDDQQAKLETVEREMYDKQREFGESTPQAKKRKEEFDAVLSGCRQEVEKTLSDMQRSKFAEWESRQQIKLGYHDLAKPEVVKLLELTQAQQNKLAALRIDFQKKGQELVNA